MTETERWGEGNEREKLREMSMKASRSIGLSLRSKDTLPSVTLSA